MPALVAAAVALAVAALLVLPGGGGSDADTAGPTRSSGTMPEAVGGTASGKAGVPGQQYDVGAGVTGSATGATTDSDDGVTRVVRTGSLSLVVDDGKVQTTVGRVEAIVAAARGYVADSTTQEAGEHPVATLTARIPVESFAQVVAKVRGIGAKVVSSQTGGRDVTAQYADTKAQIQSLQAARARFLVILGGAKTIAETLTVQQRVDDVQKQIDRLETQRRVLADSSDLATLTVTVAEESDEVLVEEEPSGWSKAWDDATDGFVGGLQSMLARSGRLLLLLLVAAVLYPLARVLVRRVRSRLGNDADGGAAPIA